MIRILNNVYGTNGWGNHGVVLAAGVHDENADTLRQVALGNGAHLTAEEEAAHVAAAAAAAEPAAEVAPAPAAAPAPAEAAAPAEAPAAEAAAPAPAAGKGKKA